MMHLVNLSADSHVYGGWNALINKLGCAEDIPFNISRHGWEGHPAVDSLPVMTNSHQDQSFPWNTSEQGHALTDDILNSPRYEIEVRNCHFVWYHAIFYYCQLNDILYLSWKTCFSLTVSRPQNCFVIMMRPIDT